MIASNSKYSGGLYVLVNPGARAFGESNRRASMIVTLNGHSHRQFCSLQSVV